MSEQINIPKPEKVYSWGMNFMAEVPVLRPDSKEAIQAIFTYARNTKTKIAFRGGGCSYGDASLNSDGLIVDMGQYNKIIQWDAESGIIKAQSGVTIQQLWEFSIERGYWPPVVSGTMFPTLGGALSMNIHGKNNFVYGPIGDHVQEFSFLTPRGDVLVCSRDTNSDLFHSAISGLGMLGCFLEVTIKLKKIFSGKMLVTPKQVSNLEDMMKYFEENYTSSDYLVGWVDSFGSGKELGRGIIHKGNYIPEGEDPDFKNSILLKNQHLPKRFFGIIPKSWMWVFMYPFANSLGMRLINLAKYISGKFAKKPYKQAHAGYAFLLDYVPNWKYIYKPGSMIQYQAFIPKENVLSAYKEILEHCQRRGFISYLSVFKKHRPDKFLLTHSLDGYSMAMDFPVKKSNRKAVWDFTNELDEIVLKNKGKFYFAKDSTLRRKIVDKAFPSDSLKKFIEMKQKLDPENILQSDLYKRIFLT
jgi:decaprenylphospho-beta-D-ribofuranose 2-oxidase